jgi:formyltetrahydrofolate-dependent phosphoribosylglycinamide formyltransferase
MLEKLRKKWKVNGWQLFVILLTFALGGSLCGFVSKKLIALIDVDKGALWIFLYIIILTITWPFCVLLISALFGQFKFFKSYIGNIWQRISGRQHVVKDITRLAIFASGAGSNANRIIAHFRNHPSIRVVLVITNKQKAGVVQIAETNGIDVVLVDRTGFYGDNSCLADLDRFRIDWVILAGFLWKLPPSLVNAYKGRIINIHPALLPKYGGKGMYGKYVHEAVIQNREKESGISIHYVDDVYDNGEIIMQAICSIDDNDDPDSLAQKIHALEHEHYPRVIESVIKQNLR